MYISSGMKKSMGTYIFFNFILQFIYCSTLWLIFLTSVILLIALLCYYVRMVLIFLYIFI